MMAARTFGLGTPFLKIILVGMTALLTQPFTRLNAGWSILAFALQGKARPVRCDSRSGGSRFSRTISHI